MTICIAAIARESNEEYIVYATDHMVTTTMGEFEHSIIKYKLLNRNTVAMLAGDPLVFDELVKLKNENIGYEDIKKEIFNNFKIKRREIIKNEIFELYGINQEFFIDALQKEIPNPYINTILQNVSNFKLGSGVLLIGFNNNGEAQITEINDANMADFRVMNFHAIGSGNIQAANTLLFQKHDKANDTLSTLYNVYKAKRNAEVLEGVGVETELLILSKHDCFKINETQMKILDNIYKTELEFGKRHKDLNSINIKNELNKLKNVHED